MSMRSIDVQNVIARSKEIEGIQRAQNRVATTGQQAFEAELLKQAEEKSSQVQSSPETEHERIRGDDKGQEGLAREKEPSEKMSHKEVEGKKDTDDPEGGLHSFPGQIIDVEV